MSMNKPVIVSNVGAYENLVIDGKNGFIISTNRPDLLSSKIITLLDDLDLRAAMGKINRTIIESRYTLEREILGFEKALESARYV